MAHSNRKAGQNRIDPTKRRNDLPANSSHQKNLFDVEVISRNIKEKAKKESDYVFEILDALTAPVLTFSQPWANAIPKRMLDVVPLARMKALLAKEELATYVECVIYIYTRTLEAPMDSEWTDIYTHVSCKTLQEWFGENHWEDTKAPKELDSWLQQKLNGLRKFIYDKRRVVIQRQMKNQKQKEKNTPQKIEVPENNQHHKSKPTENLLFDFTNSVFK